MSDRRDARRAILDALAEHHSGAIDSCLESLTRAILVLPSSIEPELLEYGDGTGKEPMRRIIRNAARCLSCMQEIESRSVHDWVRCQCGASFVDGGLEYLRRGYGPKGYDELSEYEGDVGSERVPLVRGKWKAE